MTRFVEVRTYKRSIGKRCLHCHESATVKAFRKRGRMKLPVHYCHRHAIELGALDD